MFARRRRAPRSSRSTRRPTRARYLHPIAPPDGRGVLTESRPAHHPHQTGLYWGFTRLNGRDYFHNPGADYWRRVSATVLQASGDEVRWQTVYDLLDENGAAVLTETAALVDAREERPLPARPDLARRSEGATSPSASTTTAACSCGCRGAQGINGEVVNAARQRNERAEGQRAMWVDVAMQVDGRDDLAHIAIFDHPDNGGYPQTVARRRSARRRPGARARRRLDHRPQPDRSHPPSLPRLHRRPLDDIEMTAAWTDYTTTRRTRPPRCGASRSAKGAPPRCSRRRRPRRT